MKFIWHNNIMERVATFCKYKAKKKIGSIFLSVLKFGDAKVWIVLPNNIMRFAIQK
jgi:hypothetical protein